MSLSKTKLFVVHFILIIWHFVWTTRQVGNLANDGIKLATGARERRCTLSPLESGWKMDEGWGGGRGATHRKTKNRQRAE